MKKIRLGTIGSGAIVHSVLQQMMKTGRYTLEAVYSRRAETGLALAEQYGGEKVYTDLDAFFGDDRVELVYIASPNSLHYAQAKQALLSGRHVLLEKPFCPRLWEAQELVALAKERRLLLLDAVTTAFLPNLQVLREEIGKIGALRVIDANYTQYSGRYDRLRAGEVANVFNPSFAGGCLMDLNFYNLYLNVILFGAPEEVAYYPNLYQGKIDTSGTLLMVYPGFVSQNIGAKDARGTSHFTIQGEDGYVNVENGSNGLAAIRTVTPAGETLRNAQKDPDRYFYEAEAVARIVAERDFTAMEENLAVMLQVIGVLEKARRGAGIVFPSDEG